MGNSSVEKEIENESCKRLSTLIEALTHSGANSLDEDVFKNVKKICKSSQMYIPKAYELLLKQLKKNNSQIRHLAFIMIKELFGRSGLFRELVIKDLQLIFKLSTEINSGKKLPPPKSSADGLKNLAISSLKEWVENYGEIYKNLKIAYNYFQNCKKVNFETLEVRTSAEQVVENEQHRHIQAVNSEKMKKLMEELNSYESEMETTITSLSNCLNLLLPTLEDFFIPENNLEETGDSLSISSSSKIPKSGKSMHNENEPDSNENYLRHFGITSVNYSLSLELRPNDQIKIAKTDENSSIIENAKDCVRLITNRFLPMVKKWSRICCKCTEGRSDELKKILNLKEKLDNIIKKYNKLIIDGESSTGGNKSESDDEFEEVQKEGYEESVDLTEEEILMQMGCLSKRPFKPETKKSMQSTLKSGATTSASASTSKVSEELLCSLPSTSKESNSTTKELDRKSKLLAVAPKLPYDIDLYHWEDENLTVPTLVSTKIDVDKFWGSSNCDEIHEIPNPEGLAALRTRVIEFTGKFEPVKWSCRAPLPNGRLCPRKDRVKCPFHGKIVPRDELGRCRNREDEKAENELAEKSEQPSIPDWQDPTLLQELKEATGVDLKMPEKNKKRKTHQHNNLTHKKMKTSAAAIKILESKKLPGLVDVVKRQNNAYTRLCKKLFNKSSMRRVNAMLNKLERNKFRDKFGDQFNYALR